MTSRSDTHPTDSVLQGLAQGKLNDSAANRVIDHLDDCADCRKRAAELPDGTLNLRRPVTRVAGGAPEAAPPAPGTRLPANVPADLAELTGYEIVRELGRGGMGVVYLARNLLMDRLEVLKVVNQSMVGRQDVVERFVQEIRSAARLNHPNVATAYSAQLVGEQLVLAMEYVEGDDLGKVVKNRGPLPIPFACFCAREAALGLQRGHELGLVHRDIKPSNLILTRQGKRSFVKIVDFGLAKAQAETPSDRGLTATNQMMGTLGFTAPEQLRDARCADTRADIYSLGCTLHCLLSGANPFPGASAYEVFLAQEAGGVKSLRAARPEVPQELVAIIDKMMARDAAERFRQPGEVAAALLPFMQANTKPGTEGELPAAAPRADSIRATKPEPPGPADDGTEPSAPKTMRPTGRNSPDTFAESPAGARPLTRSRGKRERQTTLHKNVRRSPSSVSWLVPLLIGAVVLTGCVVAGVALLRSQQLPTGTIVVENVPPDAELLIEGAVTPPARTGEVVTATGIAAGPHRVRLLQFGRETWSSDVTVTPGDEPLRVRARPEVAPPPQPAAPPPEPGRAAKAQPAPKAEAKPPQRPSQVTPTQPAPQPDPNQPPPPPPRYGPNGELLPPPPGPNGRRPPPPPGGKGGFPPPDPRRPPPGPNGGRPFPGQPPPRPPGNGPGAPGGF